MSVTVHVVLELPNGSLLHKSALLSAGNAAAGQLASSQPIVGVWVQREGVAGAPPEGFWDEFSGNEIYGIEDMNSDDVAIYQGDTGPDQARLRRFNGDGSTEAQRILPSKLSQGAFPGTNWDVLDGGSGSHYTQQLAAARTLIGVPS